MSQEHPIRWGRIVLSVLGVVALVGVVVLVSFLRGLPETTPRHLASSLSPDRHWIARAELESGPGGTYSEVRVCEAADTTWVHGKRVWSSWTLIPDDVAWEGADSLMILIGGISKTDSLNKTWFRTSEAHGVRVATWLRSRGSLVALSPTRPEPKP